MPVSRRGPDGTVRVAIQGNHAAVNWANVFWFNLSGGAGAPQSDIDAWLVSMHAAYKTRLQGVLHSTVNVVDATATLFQSGGTVLQSVDATAWAGSAAGTEVQDNSVCRVLSWKSNVYWRGGKPRTYLPSSETGWQSSNVNVSAAHIAILNTAGTNLHNDWNALSHGAITATQHGFVSFFAGGTPRSPAVFFPITGVTCHPRLGSQRRRLGKWQL